MAEEDRIETLQQQHNSNVLRHLHPHAYWGGTREEPGPPPEGYVPPGGVELAGAITLTPDTIAAGPADTVVGTLAMPAEAEGTPTYELTNDGFGFFKIVDDEVLTAQAVIGDVQHNISVKGTADNGWVQTDLTVSVTSIIGG